MALQLGHELRFGPRIELLEEDDAGRSVFAFVPLHAQLVPDLSCAYQQTLRIAHFMVRQDIQEARTTEVLDRRARGWMPEHALRGEHDQRLAPWSHRLPAQQMKILSCSRGLAHLHVVARR